MSSENLYEAVKNQICDEIFKGYYDDGDRIPPERELEEKLSVSRVTVRKSLEILEEEGLIVREVGRGTRVTLHNCGNKNDLDMIVLIAPARNPFFAEFIAAFQHCAEEKGSLVLYVEKPRTEDLEQCLYRLYKRGLRNAVIWLEDLPADQARLKRLRAIGMNLVFFDSDQGLPYADCVSLDNELAIRTLYEKLKSTGCEKIGYIGWDLKEVYSIRMRQQGYTKAAMSEKYLNPLPWKNPIKSREITAEVLGRTGDKKLDAVICGDRESGVIAAEAAKELGETIQIATVDELPKGAGTGIMMYRQNLEAAVEQIFLCIENQCRQECSWKARLYQLEGRLTD